MLLGVSCVQGRGLELGKELEGRWGGWGGGFLALKGEGHFPLRGRLLPTLSPEQEQQHRPRPPQPLSCLHTDFYSNHWLWCALKPELGCTEFSNGNLSCG